ncbi:MAG: haloacid dehalogenase-like hydrolase [Holosporaceae bacterium]|jgi:phosphoserine phosphatase|nr:haloacid dehalogenase-like hydrolase [Holosporaceae bacterium]
MNLLPICVDLDGTLLEGDVTQIAIREYLGCGLFNVFRILCWLLRGRAFLKQKLAELVELDVANLRYNEKFLKFVLKKKKEGHKVFLATASNVVYANQVVEHLDTVGFGGLFDGVFASNAWANLRAEAKADALVTVFGERGFIYAGNSKDDVPVWDKSAGCILVSPTNGALKKMSGQVYQLFK